MYLSIYLLGGCGWWWWVVAELIPAHGFWLESGIYFSTNTASIPRATLVWGIIVLYVPLALLNDQYSRTRAAEAARIGDSEEEAASEDIVV